MTPAQFEVVANTLTRKSSRKNKNSKKAREAARLVILERVAKVDVAFQLKMSQQSVSNTVSRYLNRHLEILEGYGS